MRKTARFFQVKGFTLIESTLALAILAILLGLSSPYLFGYKEKLILETERDKIVNSLKLAQQKSIAAYKGYDYQVQFNLNPDPDEADSFTLQPENQTTSLHPKIKISSVTPLTITFGRLSGRPDSSLDLTLVSRRFKCKISVSKEGVITTTDPERK